VRDNSVWSFFDADIQAEEHDNESVINNYLYCSLWNFVSEQAFCGMVQEKIQ
jgi:hypothetical protein